MDKLSQFNPMASAFLDKEISLPRYAVGKNPETIALSRIIDLNGIIDDYSQPKDQWHGLPLIKTKQVEKNALIANCSTSISPIAVFNKLNLLGLQNIVGLHELILSSNNNLEWPKFVQEMRSEAKSHLDEWQGIYNSLADEESRQTFLDIVGYRLTANPDYMKKYSVRLSDQYFEDFMTFSNEVFVDAGGFDGDTSEIFATRYSNYKKILFFEPSKKNMSAARKRLIKYERIEFYPIGLSDKAGVLQFNQNAGSASSFTDFGDEIIKVDMLDMLVRESVTFIKMDLEGWELKALNGSRRRIIMDHPKLALAVYHNSEDFRLISEYVMSLGLNYKIFLRHYTQGWSETIMFFLPVK